MTDTPMDDSIPATSPLQDPFASAAGEKAFDFHAARSTYFTMLLKFLVLQIITLSIYRFWAKTHVRRYLWSSTEFLGDRFEYLGTGKELFIGFLIAIVILIPLFIVGQIPVVNIVYAIVVPFLIHFAIFRLWRYRLTRTSWRGLRFGMDQDAAKYAGMAILWSIATLFSVGIAYPWMQAYLTRYKMNRVSFGTTNFQCTITGSQLFLYYLGSLICILGMSSLIMIPYFSLIGAGGQWFSQINEMSWELSIIGIPVFIGLLFISGWLQVKIANKIIGEIRLGRCKFSSHLQFRKLLPAIFGFLGCFAVFYAFLGLIMNMFGPTIEDLDNFENVVTNYLIPMYILFFFAALFVPIINKVVLEVAIMREFFKNMKITDPEVFTEIARDGKDIPTHGEGFADAFDVGAF